jgi:hypothetical protein
MTDPFILIFVIVGLIALGAFALVLVKPDPKAAKLLKWIAVIAGVIACLMGVFLAVAIAINIAYG